MALGPAFPQTQPPTMNVDLVPAPTKGLDVRAPAGNMPPDVTIYTYNLMPAEYGLLLRPGYRRWVNIPDEGAQLGVYTMMGFTSVTVNSTDNRLFAVTNEGIYDVSTYNTSIKKASFADQALGAGHGVYCQYIDQATEDFLLYADTFNGRWEYEASSDTWAENTSITGPVIGNVDFVVVHKQRLWLIEEESSSAWYLPIASKNGQATEFYFGAKFPHGGRLAGLFNWTVDGGLGVDDFLVAVSSAGDVVVYQGEDPSSATTWSVRGTYYIGEVPAGRRFASEYSGDLYFLSSFGLISMKDLIRGTDQQNNPSESSLAFRVARPLRQSMLGNINEYGWEPIFIPAAGNLVILEPPTEAFPRYVQFVMNLATEGWGLWRDVPALSLVGWQSNVYPADGEGNVWVMDSNYDGGTNESGDNGDPVEFSTLSSTTDLGTPVLNKQVQMVRPDFYAETRPQYNIDILYDYDVSEIGMSNDSIGALDDPTGYNKLSGVHGIGRKISIAMHGSGIGETRLLSWDVMWKTGGPI